MKFPLTVIGALFFCQIIWAAETDTFTDRHDVLIDSAEALNAMANDAVTSSIEQVNLIGKGCIEASLYQELRKYFGNHTNSTLVVDFSKSRGPDLRHILLDDSIYKNWSSWDGLGMGFGPARKSGLTMSPVVRIGEQLIGTDKLEHMFGQGFRYFERNYLDGKGAKTAVKFGIGFEKTILGGNKLGNGVFSYGDLSANFNGMRFWNHMLLLREDVLGPEHSHGPYIACQDNRWVQAAKIDFRHYIDDSMDEAINCSKFPSQKTANKFTNTLKSMGMSCPLDSDKLLALQKKYGKMAEWIINASGTGAVSYFGEFKKH